MTSHEFYLPLPHKFMSLRSIEGMGQKRIKLSKLVSSILDLVNLDVIDFPVQVHDFSEGYQLSEMPESEFFHYHLDYMTLLMSLKNSSENRAFSVVGTNPIKANSLSLQLNSQVLTVHIDTVNKFITQVTEVIRKQQSLLSKSDVFTNLILQDSSGNFSRPNFLFKSLKSSLREWQKINLEDLSKKALQKRMTVEPLNHGWGVQGFRLESGSDPYDMTVKVYDHPLSAPYSLSGLAHCVEELLGHAQSSNTRPELKMRYYISAPHMGLNSYISELVHKNGGELDYQSYYYGQSPIHSFVCCLNDTARDSTFLDFSALPHVRMVCFHRGQA